MMNAFTLRCATLQHEHPCVQDFATVGDSFLKWNVTKRIFEQLSYCSEGVHSSLRTKLVSNSYLAYAFIVKYGIQGLSAIINSKCNTKYSIMRPILEVPLPKIEEFFFKQSGNYSEILLDNSFEELLKELSISGENIEPNSFCAKFTVKDIADVFESIVGFTVLYVSERDAENFIE